MTSDADDGLSWEGDEDQATDTHGKAARDTSASGLPKGWHAVGKDSATVEHQDAGGDVAETAESQPLSTAMLLLVGIVGGIYLLYTVGWIIGGLNLEMSALFLVPSVMYQVAVWAAVLAPALWFAAVWLLTRRAAGWVRVLGLLAGAVLLVPWPFVMTGAVGA